jgi:hypothetical protein
MYFTDMQVDCKAGDLTVADGWVEAEEEGATDGEAYSYSWIEDVRYVSKRRVE